MTYELCLRGKGIFDDREDIDGILEALKEHTEYFEALKAKGVTLRQPTDQDYVFLLTDDPEVAEEFDFEEVKDEGDADFE
jgi:hypothetical protein